MVKENTVYTLEFYSAIKRNKIMMFSERKCMEMGFIMLEKKKPDSGRQTASVWDPDLSLFVRTSAGCKVQ